MLLCCWVAALLLPAVSRTESGDGDDDLLLSEPRIRCSSHILTTGNSLSCKLVGGRNDHEDDEDAKRDEDDGVGNMTVCCFDYSQNKSVCLEAFGDTVRSEHLNPLCPLTVTVHLKRGGRITTTVDLKKIVLVLVLPWLPSLQRVQQYVLGLQQRGEALLLEEEEETLLLPGAELSSSLRSSGSGSVRGGPAGGKGGTGEPEPGRLYVTPPQSRCVQLRSPQVNVTFDPDSHQVVIRLQTLYLKEYIRADNQLFQLHIWTPGGRHPITQNVSSDSLKIGMEHLRKHTEYRVRARSIPVNGLQGYWSEWSNTSSFFTPAEEEEEGEEVQEQTDERRETNKLIVCLVVLVAVPSSVVFFCKNKIFTYMWPNIPHPKHTLVHICKTNKGLLLNFKPEEFSALKVEKTEKQSCEEAEPEAAADDMQSNPSCSTRSSDGSGSTTSAGTEELELSALLSRSSSSDGEDGLRSVGPSPVEDLRLGERPLTPQPECSSGGNEAEAYVTMSSFYQIK